jgi:hypothetical protein
MNDPEATRAARALNRARWGTSVVTRALDTLRERGGELDELQRAELRVLADDLTLDIGEGQRTGLRALVGQDTEAAQ